VQIILQSAASDYGIKATSV